jgi:hypothetical protein
MNTDIRTRSKSIIRGVVLVLLLAGAVMTAYVFKESEPLKVFMFGAVLIGLAVWGKRSERR